MSTRIGFVVQLLDSPDSHALGRCGTWSEDLSEYAGYLDVLDKRSAVRQLAQLAEFLYELADAAKRRDDAAKGAS